MGFEEENKRIGLLCADCRGKCCRGHHIILSGKEFIRLKKKKDFPSKRINSPTGCAINTIDALTKKRCPFLGEDGCELKPRERPLICRLYPLTPAPENKNLVFYLSSLCPHAEEIKEMKEWIKETIRECRDELSTWESKETVFLGKRKRKQGEKLISIDL